MSGLSLSYDLPGDHPLTGQRVPDAGLVLAGDDVTGGERTRLSALFAAGHAVLLDLAGVIPPGTRLPPRVDHVRATCADGPPADALLLRPDGYACWAADDQATALATLDTALARVTSATPTSGH
jgi:hypothetical protein